jgi:hypothetical protein
MNFIKKHLVFSGLLLLIILILLFILGESSFKEVTRYIPSTQTQLAQVSSSLSSGLIAHYTFDDGTAADSAGSNNGTLTGGPTPVAGKVGSGALSFDGVDDVVSSGASVNVASSDQFSYSFWIKAPQTSGAPVSFGVYRACGRDGMSIRCTVDGDSSGSATVGSVYDNAWHHIVFINNGNTQTIYKDNVQGGSATETKSTQGGILRMGNGLSSSSFFGGQLDDVRIYDRALTTDDIGALYALGGGSIPAPQAVNGSCGSAAKQYTVNEVFPQGGYCASGTATPSSPTDPTVSAASAWSCSGSNGGTQASCSASRTSSQQSTTATLTVIRSGTGSGAVTGSGISCGADCSETVSVGTTIVLSATPSSGSTLSSWSGGGCSGTGTCSVVASSDVSITATFTSDSQQILNAGGPNWYVDKNATGAHNGTSWADAYTTFASINWALIQPGHTVWVSGGVYPEYVVIGKKGTQANPIRIKVSQESGHNSLVTVSGFSMNDADWITIDGAKNDGYESNIGNNTFNVPLVKNNINLKVDAKILDNHGFNMGAGGVNGFKVKWIELTTSDEDRYGFRFNPSTDMGFDNIEVSYSWIHDTGTDAVYQTQNIMAHWDVMVVHHNLIEGVGDDGLEVAQGLTFHHNLMRNNRHLRGHADGLQTTGNYQLHFHRRLFQKQLQSKIYLKQMVEIPIHEHF